MSFLINQCVYKSQMRWQANFRTPCVHVTQAQAAVTLHPWRRHGLRRPFSTYLQDLCKHVVKSEYSSSGVDREVEGPIEAFLKEELKSPENMFETATLGAQGFLGNQNHGGNVTKWSTSLFRANKRTSRRATIFFTLFLISQSSCLGHSSFRYSSLR